MNLEDLREKIDQIDQALMELFKARMAVSKEIGLYKRAHDLPVLDRDREDALIHKRKALFNDDYLWPYYEAWLKETMKLSKEYQHE